jgi:two-component system chemotaxis response regulator CheV
MAGILEGVDQRTQLVGHNRMELLLFRLAGKQRYGINVFKVSEVIQCPHLTQVPSSHPVVRGIANIRGKTISIIDLGAAVGQGAVASVDNHYVIIAEYNRTTIGFLVSGVERIINLNWGDIIAPPKASGREHYLTAVTRVDNELVEILDVEKILSQVMGDKSFLSQEVVAKTDHLRVNDRAVLVVDDSSVARNQIKRTLDRLGVQSILAVDGKQAWETLGKMAQNARPVGEQIGMIICDIEMPNMDGYTLTSLVKGDPRFKDLFILLHTSLSGVFNRAMVEKVGANAFVPKFEPDDLANAIIERFQSLGAGTPAPDAIARRTVA